MAAESLMLFQGCEAFWRDVKYAVMARNYRLVNELSTELRAIRRDGEPSVAKLQAWLLSVKRIEVMPTTDTALRNTAYHLLGYWKDILPADVRRAMSDLAIVRPDTVIDILHMRLADLPSPYLTTSYVWRDEPWTEALFRVKGSAYRFQVNAEHALAQNDPALIDMTVLLDAESA